MNTCSSIKTTKSAIWLCVLALLAAPVHAESVEVRLAALDQQIEMAESRMQKAIEQRERMQRLTDEHVARSSLSGYPPVAMGTRTQLVNQTIGMKHNQVRLIARLVQAKVKVAQALPLPQQLQLVELELERAQVRNSDDPTAVGNGLVSFLIETKGQLRQQMIGGGTLEAETPRVEPSATDTRGDDSAPPPGIWFPETDSAGDESPASEILW